MVRRVVKPKEKEQLPAAIDFGADAGSGFEGTNKDDFAIPFIAILQALSPQCKRQDGAYIEGAEEGMILNSVTQNIIDGEAGIRVIPVAYQRRMTEWALRENGGGFGGEHLPEEAPRIIETDHKNRDILANGNQLVDTRSHFVLILTDQGPIPAIISMSSTQLKKSKRWMSLMQGLRIDNKPMPMFGNIFQLTTVPESNKEGDWYGWKIVHDSQVADPELYQAAKDFKEAILVGSVKVDRPTDETEGDDKSEDDIPF